MAEPRLTLQIKVVKCIALKRIKVSSSKKADPYVILQVEDTVASTGVKEATLDPIYNETFAFDVTHDFLEKEKGRVTVKVCHHDGGQGKLMGEFALTFAKLVDGTNYLQLHAPKSKELVGSVVLAVAKASVVNQYIRNKADALAVAKGSGGSSGGRFDKPLLSYQKAALSKVPGTSKHINSLTPTKQGTTYPIAPGSDKKSPTKITKKFITTTVGPSPSKGSKPGMSPKKKDTRNVQATTRGGPLGFVGSLIKNSIKLGFVGGVTLLGISYVPEDKLDNEVTRFAKRARKEAQEKIEVWGEIGVENAKKLSEQGKKAAGNGVKVVSKEYSKLVGGVFGKSYMIKRGDTLSKLAYDNNTTVERLLAKNGMSNMKDKDFIIPGKVIKV